VGLSAHVRVAYTAAVFPVGVAALLLSAQAATVGLAAPVVTSGSGFVAVDVAREAGLQSENTRTWSAATVDYDRNGTQDVLINHHFLGAKLWSNDGTGRYVRRAADAWPAERPDRHTCTWADVDHNGRQDAYCATGRGLKNVVKSGDWRAELWLQSRAGRFREAAAGWGVGDVCGRGASATFIYANRDRKPDLFVGNEPPYKRKDDPCDTSRRLPNEQSKVFLNVGNERFEYAPRFAHFPVGVGAHCAVVLDFNRDGRDDLLACRKNDTPRLYKNVLGRRFDDVTGRQGIREVASDAYAADLDRDRDLDLVMAGPRGFAFHRNTGRHFEPARFIARTGVGEGFAVAVGDADGDGDGDVYGMVGNGDRGNPDDKIFLNKRLSFTPVRVPSAHGAADDVIVLDPEGSGRAAFLALNGYNLAGRGPVQLIQLKRVG
jgi:hypothetical protein